MGHVQLTWLREGCTWVIADTGCHHVSTGSELAHMGVHRRWVVLLLGHRWRDGVLHDGGIVVGVDGRAIEDDYVLDIGAAEKDVVVDVVLRGDLLVDDAVLGAEGADWKQVEIQRDSNLFTCGATDGFAVWKRLGLFMMGYWKHALGKDLGKYAGKGGKSLLTAGQSYGAFFRVDGK